MNWEHRDLWLCRGRDFCVEVSRHNSDTDQVGEGSNRWCVYAYIYPNHAHFKNFSGDKIFQSAATALPLHGGPTLLRYHTSPDGLVRSIQVGSDYNHIGDEHFTYDSTKEEATIQFSDAEELFAWLAKYNSGHGGAA